MRMATDNLVVKWLWKPKRNVTDSENIFFPFLFPGSHRFRRNESNLVEEEILNVTYEDGKWSKPYFDCGGGNIWMITYTIPFFGYNGTYYFKWVLFSSSFYFLWCVMQSKHKLNCYDGLDHKEKVFHKS